MTYKKFSVHMTNQTQWHIGECDTIAECIALCESDGQTSYLIYSQDGLEAYWSCTEGITRY